MTFHDKLQTVRIKCAQIDAIYDEIDAILDPLCREVMAGGNVNEIKALIYQLPTGFHRSELHTYLNKVNNDKST